MIINNLRKEDLLNQYINGEKNSEELIDRIIELEEALKFYGDASKYYYARKDHPNTRIAEDCGKIARKVLGDELC